MSLRDRVITLDGVELVRLLREYSTARCDAVGLATARDFDKAVESRLWREDEEAWLKCLSSKELRAEFSTLSGAKDFVDERLRDKGFQSFVSSKGGKHVGSSLEP